MNLQEFLNYRTTCPLCNSNLITYFHSERSQSIKFEDNRLVVYLDIRSITSFSSKYKIAYSFDLNDNTWYIDFYDNATQKIFDYSPEFLRKRYLELNKNLGLYRFKKLCKNNWCSAYKYSTSLFELLPNNSIKTDIDIEYFGLYQKNDSEYKLYRVLNHYPSETTTLGCKRESDISLIRYDYGTYNISIDNFSLLNLPLLNFVSKDHMLDKLSKIMVFS